MGAIAKIKQSAKALITRHGAEAGVCAKVAVAALMPGGEGLPEVVRALCDDLGQKDADALPDERVLALLGELKDDQNQVVVVMERLGDQISDVMAQMVGIARFQVPEEALTHIVEVAISTRSEVMAVRQELMGLQADMSVIQAQNDEVLRRLNFAGDALSQVKDALSAALGFCAPLLSEGVPADKTHDFLQAHMRCQRCLVRGELSEAEEALEELKAISATSDTVRVCEVALRAMRRDFEGAERVAQTISMSARGDARVGRVTQSFNSLTQGAELITRWVLQPHLYEGLSASLQSELSRRLTRYEERLAELERRLDERDASRVSSAARPVITSVSHQAGDLISCRAKGVEFKMAWCPAGEFWMGSEEGVGHDDEHPCHRVKISKPFLMGQTQVTQALWEAVMGANPSHFKGAQRPVEQVSWYDMARFCNALSTLENFRPAYSIGSGDKPNISLDFSANGYRMPTEAEWEYAAKAGTELVYAGGTQLEQVGWFNSNSEGETHPVAQKRANAWGLHDMSGNVWEWCSDKLGRDTYQSRTKCSVDPSVYVSSTAKRVIRGGAWRFDAYLCRVAVRGGCRANGRWFSLGGRLLRWNLDS